MTLPEERADLAASPLAPEGIDDRKALADLIHDDQREQCDLDPEGFYDCEQLADRILAAGYRRPTQAADPEGNDGWIACADRMPEEREDVLVWGPQWCDGHTARFNVRLIVYNTGPDKARTWFGHAGDHHESAVTHWRPIPPPPQAVQP